MANHQIEIEPKHYRRRMRWALIAALSVHASLLLLPLQYRGNGPLIVALPPDPQPLVVALTPKDEPKKLIAPGAPTESPVDPATDLIAERASKAQDTTPGEGQGITPDTGAVGTIDDLISSRAPKTDPPAVPKQPVPAESVAPAPKANPDDAPRASTKIASNERPDQKPIAEAKADKPVIHENQEKLSDAKIQLAKAEAPQIPAHVMGKTQSHVEGGVKSLGFLSFEAKQSEFAPYLREVRNRVENRWKAIIHVRYSGSSTAQAVLDCAIAPDGTLGGVSIVDPGSSATFAGLCKQAIEQAGPFGPFPFDVPEVYQNQHIEIRWTFSFL